MKRNFSAILLLFTISALMSGQNSQGSKYFVSGSEIAVEVTPDGRLVYSSVFEKGHSVYHLSKVFKTDVPSIFKMNNLAEGSIIAEGKNINVLFPKEALITTPSFGIEKVPHLRIMYIVKPGETLYRISKVYFGQSVADVKERNKLKSDQLGAGDLLLMGWLPLGNDPAQTKEITRSPSTETKTSDIPKLQNIDVGGMSGTAKHDSADVQEGPLYVSGQAIALWDKSNRTTKSLYVLHNEARIGSEMELFFPLVRSNIKAKVVGRIPEGTYTEDIALYVSPKVARQLGVIDPRFQVNIKYLK